MHYSSIFAEHNSLHMHLISNTEKVIFPNECSFITCDEYIPLVYNRSPADLTEIKASMTLHKMCNRWNQINNNWTQIVCDDSFGQKQITNWCKCD